MCVLSPLCSPLPVCRGLAPASLLPPDEADLVDGALSVLGLVPHQVGGAGATLGGWVMVGLVPHQVGGSWWG